MNRKSKATMRELISDAKPSPSQQKKSRIPSGIHDGVLTDRKGQTYTLSAQGITAEDALRFVDLGAQVVFDECGCGGTCGFVYATEDDVPALGKKKPVMKTHKGLTGELSVWQSEQGEKVLLATGPVEWI
ncbi:MAG: hypothetical protein F2621_02055 [Actinobacteria bacterium]|uniref:Unannotated protein n=1 Tax=freshwater metagenome TaxID=449393 RepID=A0A6J6JQ57_9ZZZZ|nr:hypothetical protein [Actinomycetota bacterium]